MVALTMALLLSACAARPPQPPAELEQAIAERKQALAQWQRWGLVARLGVDTGTDGGSGRIDWQLSPGAGELQFRGTLGQGSFQLTHNETGAQLLRADRPPAYAQDVDQLVGRETGWQVPVLALQWWVRGLAMPEEPAQIERDEAGLPQTLEQLGWQITYSRYMEHAGQQLPRRLQASKDNFEIKVAVARWRLDDDQDG